MNKTIQLHDILLICTLHDNIAPCNFGWDRNLWILGWWQCTRDFRSTIWWNEYGWPQTSPSDNIHVLTPTIQNPQVMPFIEIYSTMPTITSIDNCNKRHEKVIDVFEPIVLPVVVSAQALFVHYLAEREKRVEWDRKKKIKLAREQNLVVERRASSLNLREFQNLPSLHSWESSLETSLWLVSESRGELSYTPPVP